MTSDGERIAVLEERGEAQAEAITRIDRRTKRLPKVMRRIVREEIEECRKGRNNEVGQQIAAAVQPIATAVQPRDGGLARTIGWVVASLGAIGYGIMEGWNRLFGGTK